MDERFLKDEGLEVFTGNELVLKGALESEAALITGYPGSPVSEIFDAAYANRDLLKKHGVLAEMANNEALSVARLNGSRMAGVRAMAVMKSVGLNVASDGLALGNLSEPNNQGGSIVVVGDDPWIDSTQINNDSRFLSQHLHMPVLEPATFQELKDWVGTAFELSSVSNLYMTYLVTTPQADGGGTVWVRPNRYPKVHTGEPATLDTQQFNLEATVLLPPRTWAREATLSDRFEILLREIRQRKLNTLLHVQRTPASGGKGPIGFVASGLSYCYLEHALSELGLADRFPILKLGVTYPVDSQAVLELAGHVETIFVIEEKRGFVEAQIIGILHDARQSGRLTPTVDVWGKKFPGGHPGIPEKRGINASLLMERLIPVLREQPEMTQADQDRLRRELRILEATAPTAVGLPARTPTFCPGCPHRDSSSVLLEVQKDFKNRDYMKRTHSAEPVDLVFHGETGCFTMLMYEPNKPLMHNYSGMGLGGGTGAGLDPFVTNKQVVFLGDSTFFHSGMVAISDSIKSRQDITYIILDNKTTAMTGHQPTAGTERDLMGERTPAQDIAHIVRGMASDTTIPVTRVNPEYRQSYRELLEDTVLKDGVKVIIADKECGLTYHRQVRQEKKRTQRRLGYIPEEKHVNITPEVCEFCLECTNVTGCPGLTIESTLYGPKIVTDQTSCVSDGACAKVKACPSFEDVIITRKGPGVGRPALPRWGNIPEPAPSATPDPWYGFTAGVGGMGAGLISAVLVEAAQHEGRRVLFSDKKGLAVRNGGVYGHLVISRSGGALAPLVPYGKADLLLGIDMLEATRALDGSQNLRVAHAERTAAVLNNALNPTVMMLMGRDPATSNGWEDLIRRNVRTNGYWAADVSAISERYFGSKLYVNMILLGVALQRGHLPVGTESVEWAMAQVVAPAERETNLMAFRAGRWLALHPDDFALPQKAHTVESLMLEKQTFLTERLGPAVAQQYRWMVTEAFLDSRFDETLQRDIAVRAYDLIFYEGLELARRYLGLVTSTARRDRSQWGYEATRAVVHGAFKVMAIKDEVYVAHLLTSPEKRERDRLRFSIDPARGDRVEYRHLTRPEFTVFGRSWRWDMVTHDWQLRIMRQFKFLRRLLPAWHKDEREFRDWYLDLAHRFDAETEEAYKLWVQILSSPAGVSGYREIRKPKMVEARLKSENCLKRLFLLQNRSSEPYRFPPSVADETPHAENPTEISQRDSSP